MNQKSNVITGRHYVALGILFGAAKLLHGVAKPALDRMGPVAKLAAYPVLFGISLSVGDSAYRQLYLLSKELKRVANEMSEAAKKEANTDA